MNSYALDPLVQASLQERNARIASFWLSDPEERVRCDPMLAGREVLVVDAEDAFTAMLTQQLAAVGLDVTLGRFDDAAALERRWDLVVMGPGPGDPRNMTDPRIARLHRMTARLLAGEQAFLAVCLSHQVLCLQLGLNLVKRPIPNQGAQRQIDLFGRRELVGFYNTYAAKCSGASFVYEGRLIEVCRDAQDDDVHALRASGFVSFQFHAESLLTQHGVEIISSNVKRLLGHEGDN